MVIIIRDLYKEKRRSYMGLEVSFVEKDDRVSENGVEK